jgi:isoleucyl-tRNA synthetase
MTDIATPPNAASQPYAPVNPSPSFPAIENEVLARWASEGAFKESVENRQAGLNGANEYVFYDGPPFANGLPHYGHLLTSYVKDVVPRYQTMRGRRVERRFGWDTHGMPAEVHAENELGVSGHNEIKAFGIDKFNEACRTSVLRYTKEWEHYINRAARWVDFENDYKTLDLPYMESVMWAFKTLYDKGLIYEGYKVMPYCWRCETPLSNTELKMDDAYKMRQDPAVTITFPLLDDAGAETSEVLMAWTTTPWTLPSNLACAVGPEIEYAKMLDSTDGKTYILATARLGSYAKELANAEQVGTLNGSDLVGRRYKPLFPYFSAHTNAFQVAAAEYVTTEDGTGIVHIAPAYGEEDKLVTDALGIEPVSPVDQRGRFTNEVPDYFDKQVFEANPIIIKDLRGMGRLVRHDSYDHSYPHCWRCASPLIYRALSSWFVEVTKFRDRMVELNKDITWVPEHVKEGSFGKWIANARDWGISRNRFWGSPIPVWKSTDPTYPRIDVYGSLDDIERDFGVRPTDLHRPVVDDLTRPNPDDPTGQSMMVRVTEVLDCWFESGSMPFAQVHYPFENKEWFEHHYPGDFIVEYIGQTRGWFYTLHVLATALFDRPAFDTCMAHGIVLGSDGMKMSKSLKNYPDVYEVFNNHGSDAMRWYLMSSPILRGGDFAVTETGIRDAVRQVVLPIWNTYSFFTLYANASSYTAKFNAKPTDTLDQYIIGKLHILVRDVSAQMDAYDLFAACGSIRSFLDALTNWYVRRSRERFWDGDAAAFDTLFTVLRTVCQVAAPLLPLTTEAVFTGLGGASAQSVHLGDWPGAETFGFDATLDTAMDRVRSVCSAASAVRKATGRRVRQPLASLTVASESAGLLEGFQDIIADEMNVRVVILEPNLSAVATPQAKPIPAKLGPKLGNRMKDFMSAFKSAGAVVARGSEGLTATVTLADGTPVILDEHEFDFSWTVVAAAGTGGSASGNASGNAAENAWAPLDGNTGVVLLDIVLTPELSSEGLARDVVRVVQQARKDADLHVSDRIALTVSSADGAVLEALRTHEALISGEVLATSYTVAEKPHVGSTEATIGDDNLPLQVQVLKA